MREVAGKDGDRRKAGREMRKLDRRGAGDGGGKDEGGASRGKEELTKGRHD